ncbi:transposase-like zinc-binding domain-containing protein [Persicobacter psychrovividus]|uniref:Insertion element iso-IS1N protein InsA n=1 Tax=Persicobacter psychrovividus TaxID=387638 RepID=A0ABM7VE70_9BACT|nr:insertion element iso-IS1N protein InsA [Persicobacter psychrovividus]
MRHYTEITCKHCQSNDIVKNGHRSNGDQRWRCKSCRKSFQVTYRSNAYVPGIEDKIDEMTLNASGVRDIARVLKISKYKVMSHLKKKCS